jgi:sporulation protein YlmC with PRC-barrel domain
MLRSIENLEKYTIGATDGTIGKVKDFYFDDKAWVIRYLVVDTGTWLSSRMVLISPISLGQPDEKDMVLPASLTRAQVTNSPDIDTQKPVSRQHELEYFGYYGYPYYWGGGGLWGEGLYPDMMLSGYGGFGSADATSLEAANTADQAEMARREVGDPHLRSSNKVMTYYIHATDGEIGHVQGVLVEEKTWAIRYLIVNTSNWWLGHQVLIAPQWIEDVSWLEGTVSVNLTRQAVKDAPSYDPAMPLERHQEDALVEHYSRPGYWTDAPKRDTDISRI